MEGSAPFIDPPPYPSPVPRGRSRGPASPGPSSGAPRSPPPPPPAGRRARRGRTRTPRGTRGAAATRSCTGRPPRGEGADGPVQGPRHVVEDEHERGLARLLRRPRLTGEDQEASVVLRVVLDPLQEHLA